ncbi:MAG TPA: cbb3-type cytochrome oxidase assembly protein [Bacilli bacterium]|nr:cbb3-type cytochrome oxidase assembly protein [Bacilli bacterium]
MMSMSAILLLLIMICFSGSAVLMYVLAKKDGQFDDVEGIKYRMLSDE